MVLRHACRLSLEGIVSKDRDAPYRSGRGKDWIKSKCSERQEFVVGGLRALDGVDSARSVRWCWAISTGKGWSTSAASVPGFPQRWRRICSGGSTS